MDILGSIKIFIEENKKTAQEFRDDAFRKNKMDQYYYWCGFLDAILCLEAFVRHFDEMEG